MAKTVFDVINSELAGRKDALARALIDGSAKSYEEYKDMCGEIRGLSFAHMVVEALARKMETADDDDPT